MEGTEPGAAPPLNVERWGVLAWRMEGTEGMGPDAAPPLDVERWGVLTWRMKGMEVWGQFPRTYA